MLGRTGVLAAGVGVALLAAAVPNGNLVVAGLGLVPLVLVALAGGHPRDLAVAVDAPGRAVRTREPFDVTVTVRARGPAGLVHVAQPLPDEWELVSGDNVHLWNKPPGAREARFSFRVRCARRGRFHLSPAHVLLRPWLGLHQPGTAVVGEGATVLVRAELARFKRVPGGHRLASRFLPHGDQAKFGLQTSDFRDLRDYQRGDAPKAINWRATARRATRAPPGMGILPMVNEYESEGQRNVWVFLDCGEAMRVGNNVENSLESGVQAAAGLAGFFLDRGFRVGMSLYDLAEPVHLLPEAGQRQMMRIERALHAVDDFHLRGGLGAAIEGIRGHLHGGRTWAIVVTRVEAMTPEDLEHLRALRNAVAVRRGGSQLLVVSPDPYGQVPLDHEAADVTRGLLRGMDAPAHQAVRRLGVQTIHWDPEGRPLHAHLLGVRK